MKWCYGCFQLTDDAAQACPYCGFSLQTYNLRKWILRPGTMLNGKYLVGRTLGEGGFGITYLAWDTNMRIKTAIKEYYPGSMVSRDTTSGTGNLLTTTSGERDGDFEEGLKRYVNEAAILSRFFELPGIVSVKDFFYENATAYIVMEYIEGVSLKKYLEEKGGRIPAKEALALIRPLISSLAVIHQNKLLHRDISPDNIMLEINGNIKLIDFGAARYFDGEGDRSMTVMLKHGYAPIEQYSRRGEQGAGTDIYGLCAVLYRMLTGQVPVEAAERIREDKLIPVRKLAKKTPRYVAAAIERGLSVLSENRQQSMGELYAELFNARKVWIGKQAEKFHGFLKKFLIGMVICLALIFTLEVIYFFNRDKIGRFWDKAKAVFGEEEAEAPKEEEQDTKTRQKEEEPQEKTAAADRKEDAGSASGEGMAPAGVGGVSTDSTDAAAETDDTEAPALEYSYRITVVRDGVLNGYNQDLTVGDILDRYSDIGGAWDEYEANGLDYVSYHGRKNGESFVIDFRVFSDDTFKLAGAEQGGAPVEAYSDFFQQILDEAGVY